VVYNLKIWMRSQPYEIPAQLLELMIRLSFKRSIQLESRYLYPFAWVEDKVPALKLTCQVIKTMIELYAHQIINVSCVFGAKLREILPDYTQSFRDIGE
jgi:hypothetical protein